MSVHFTYQICNILKIKSCCIIDGDGSYHHQFRSRVFLFSAYILYIGKEPTLFHMWVKITRSRIIYLVKITLLILLLLTNKICFRDIWICTYTVIWQCCSNISLYFTVVKALYYKSFTFSLPF